MAMCVTERRKRGPVTVPDGAKACSKCGKVKPAGEFYPYRRGAKTYLMSPCKVCERLAKGGYLRSDAGRAARAAYLARPGVRAARRASDRRRRAASLARRRERERTARGRLIRNRDKARSRLRRAATDRSRARIAATIALYDAELARYAQRG